jgi:hypothetical protein
MSPGKRDPEPGFGRAFGTIDLPVLGGRGGGHGGPGGVTGGPGAAAEHVLWNNTLYQQRNRRKTRTQVKQLRLIMTHFDDERTPEADTHRGPIAPHLELGQRSLRRPRNAN